MERRELGRAFWHAYTHRGWDGWMASLTQWTWVWVNSGSWWWTGRPGVLQFMVSRRVGHDLATELNWTEYTHKTMTTNILKQIYFNKKKTQTDREKWSCKFSSKLKKKQTITTIKVTNMFTTHKRLCMVFCDPCLLFFPTLFTPTLILLYPRESLICFLLL